MTINKTTALLQAADALEALGKALRVLSGEVIEFTGRKTKWPERGAEKEEAAKAESTPVKAEAAPEPGAAAEPDAPTLEQVRSVLAQLSRKGATDEVRDILADLGCSKLSEVPAERYPEVLERAKGIQRSYR